MNPSYMAFVKAVLTMGSNMAKGIEHTPKSAKLNQTDGKLFAAKKGEFPRSDMVMEAEAAEKEVKVRAHLEMVAAEAKLRADKWEEENDGLPIATDTFMKREALWQNQQEQRA